MFDTAQQMTSPSLACFRTSRIQWQHQPQILSPEKQLEGTITLGEQVVSTRNPNPKPILDGHAVLFLVTYEKGRACA